MYNKYWCELYYFRNSYLKVRLFYDSYQTKFIVLFVNNLYASNIVSDIILDIKIFAVNYHYIVNKDISFNSIQYFGFARKTKRQLPSSKKQNNLKVDPFYRTNTTFNRTSVWIIIIRIFQLYWIYKSMIWILKFYFWHMASIG